MRTKRQRINVIFPYGTTDLHGHGIFHSYLPNKHAKNRLILKLRCASPAARDFTVHNL